MGSACAPALASGPQLLVWLSSAASLPCFAFPSSSPAAHCHSGAPGVADGLEVPGRARWGSAGPLCRPSRAGQWAPGHRHPGSIRASPERSGGRWPVADAGFEHGCAGLPPISHVRVATCFCPLCRRKVPAAVVWPPSSARLLPSPWPAGRASRRSGLRVREALCTVGHGTCLQLLLHTQILEVFPALTTSWSMVSP